MNLLDHFSKVFVINLSSRPDRWDAFQKRAEAAEITGFSRFEAINGHLCQPPAWWRASSGAWGCLMSHVGIAQEAIQAGLENYLVLEDDVIFSDDFSERLPRIVQNLDGIQWDQLYLGGQHLFERSSPPWPFRDGVVRCKNVNRTHAMAISKRFVLKFYQHIMHSPDYLANHVHPTEGVEEWFPHIDHQLGYLHERGQHLILAAHPWLCGQSAGISEVNGEDKPEEWWHDEGWGK